jgi:hypothetical protein
LYGRLFWKEEDSISMQQPFPTFQVDSACNPVGQPQLSRNWQVTCPPPVANHSAPSCLSYPYNPSYPYSPDCPRRQ